MAISGVLRPGHVQMRVMDMEKSVKFYTDVVGLIETGRDDSGRVYFKTWDERDHNSLILREADSPGLDFYGLKVLDVATLDKLEKDLKHGAYLHWRYIKFLAGNEKNKYEKNIPSDGQIDRLQIVRYPSGGGELKEHIDSRKNQRR